jgi:hypothetical protein
MNDPIMNDRFKFEFDAINLSHQPYAAFNSDATNPSKYQFLRPLRYPAFSFARPRSVT